MLYKAHLVTQGFSQVPSHDYEETYSPVAHYDSLQLLFCLAAAFGLNVEQSDINIAYLYGILKQKIWMKLLSGFEQSRYHVLLKCYLYNLKQNDHE